MRNIIKFSFLIWSYFTFAQVGVNTNAPRVNLDINSTNNINQADGVMTVRLTGDELRLKNTLYTLEHNSTVVYVTTVPQSPNIGKTEYITTPGFYYYKQSSASNPDSGRWVNLTMPKFFYMPSVLITATTTQPVDLYELYKTQFTAPAVSSQGSSGKIPILGKNDLEYYISYYDDNQFSNLVITQDGKLSYNVLGNPSSVSFMNIIFVVK